MARLLCKDKIAANKPKGRLMGEATMKKERKHYSRRTHINHSFYGKNKNEIFHLNSFLKGTLEIILKICLRGDYGYPSWLADSKRWIMCIISRKDAKRRRVKGHGLEHKGYTNGRLGGDRKHNKIKIKFDSLVINLFK